MKYFGPTIFALTAVTAEASDPVFKAFEYHVNSAAEVSLGCTIDDVKKTHFSAQEKFFKRMGYCLARNPHMGINARSELKLKPKNCPKNQRMFFEIPTEMEKDWVIPAREKLVFNGLSEGSYELVSVGLTSDSKPCRTRTMDMYSEATKTVDDLTVPEIPLNRTYIVVDGLSSETKRSIESMTTRVTLNLPKSLDSPKEGIYYCQAGCCGVSGKCRNSELRNLADPGTLLRRANSCIRRFGNNCELSARDRMRWDLDIQDVYLCGNNAIGVNLNVTISQFSVQAGGLVDLGLVPSVPKGTKAVIKVSQSGSACGKDAKPWFEAALDEAQDNWVINKVYDMSFSKPFLILTSDQVEVYDTYHIALPLVFRSSVADTEVKHTEFFGV